MRKLPRMPEPKSLPTKHRIVLKSARTSQQSGTNNIEAHDYSPETGQLTVTFSGGRRYAYSGVSKETAAGLDKADSKGHYLHTHVIGKHDHSKIPD